MRKLLAALLLMVMATALLVGCKSEAEKKAEQQKELDRQVLGIGSDKSQREAEEDMKKWLEKGPKKPESTTQKQ